ncbi:MAG: hypothetical protein N3B16_02690 [Candidatus Aminicenantes bacterium]|nr:hypothetical protein [Candidatus Aminicenantes bacterium]
MFKKVLTASLTLILFVAFLAAPGLNSAEKRVSKFDPISFLKKPFAFVSTFLPIFGISFDTNSTKTNPETSTGKVKPTADASGARPSGGD